MENLEPILKYNMTPLQARAYKLSLIWMELVKKEFPNDKHDRLRKNGDPRKSMLFRHCLKLAQDTQNLIRPEEYKLYILAQLRIMGKQEENGVHPYIEPQILTGPKAWKRWKSWKYDYDKRMRQSLPDASEITMSPIIVCQQLANTKNFLKKQGVNTKGLVQLMVDSGQFKEWFKMEKISPYYLMLSSFVKAAIGSKDLQEVFDQDFLVYKITSEVEDYFEKNFDELVS